MVVWEDREVLKPPKPPIVHATGYVLTKIEKFGGFFQVIVITARTGSDLAYPIAGQ